MYLLELRVRLVEDTLISVTKRLFELRQKMSPELRAYLKGMPAGEQPQTLEDTYSAVRRWIEVKRAASGDHGGGGDQRGQGRFRGRRGERSWKATEGNEVDQKTRSSGNVGEKHIATMIQQGVQQALSPTLEGH